MGNIGILEVVIILMAAVAVIGVIILSAIKLIKSKLTPTQKVVWLIVMLFFHILGVVIFLIYHDYYLTPELRANL